MRPSVIILLIILFLIFHAPASAFYKWYDEKGFVHYTEADPPYNARDEDGSSWWGIEPDQEKEKRLREKKLKRIRTKIKIRRFHESESQAKPTREIDIDIDSFSEYPSENSEQAIESIEEKGFFRRLFDFFSKEEEEERPECAEPWLLAKHGICALNKPDMKAVGNTFKAKVTNNRKGVWSHCRGTYNGDILTFTFKGGTYWETDGNVPGCPFYRGFYWNPPGR